MRRHITGLLLFLSLMVAASLSVHGATLHFEQHGFTINALEGKSDAAVQSVLYMFLPPTPDTFQPNITIVVEEFPGTIHEYMELAMQQLQAADFNLIDTTIDTEAGYATFEYTGSTQGLNLHWFGKVGVREGQAYVVTATASAMYWRTVAEKLKNAVNSFVFD